MVSGGLILFFGLVFDRLIGDPKSRLHPVVLIGNFIDLWGKRNFYPKSLERFIGFIGWVLTVLIFILPFLIAAYLPWYLSVPIGAVLLSFCIGWKSLEGHVRDVEEGLMKSESDGKSAVQMLVSRNVETLSDEEIRSAAYESASENLVDSITAPIFWFFVFEIFFGAGIIGAALFRAANTMDAMLGYKDDRIRLGWFSARADDCLAYVPARVTGMVLLVIFTLKKRGRAAWNVFHSDRKKRPGVNGGITMSLIAGGCGVLFKKPDVYIIGSAKQSLKDGGSCILKTIRETTMVLSGILILVLLVTGL